MTTSTTALFIVLAAVPPRQHFVVTDDREAITVLSATDLHTRPRFPLPRI